VSADIFVHLIFRFVHIACVILFLGGVVYARQVLVPTLNLLAEDARRESAVAAQAFFRNTLFTLLTLIVISGLYNFLAYQGPKHSTTYQMWFGIKMLAVAHLLATAILWGTSPFGDVRVGGKNKQRTISMAITGLVVVLISSYLRSLSQRGL
jgi:hypothetical protein